MRSQVPHKTPISWGKSGENVFIFWAFIINKKVHYFNRALCISLTSLCPSALFVLSNVYWCSNISLHCQCLSLHGEPCVDCDTKDKSKSVVYLYQIHAISVICLEKFVTFLNDFSAFRPEVFLVHLLRQSAIQSCIHPL